MGPNQFQGESRLEKNSNRALEKSRLISTVQLVIMRVKLYNIANVKHFGIALLNFINIGEHYRAQVFTPMG